ncbi:MAG: zinc ribbon domain-containing protein, partial [Succinivibrio sp.]
MYPSSQTCPKCGYKNTLVKDLSVREWECPCWHSRHDRDLNASVNILNKGLS